MRTILFDTMDELRVANDAPISIWMSLSNKDIHPIVENGLVIGVEYGE